jgi:nicotinamidase-related amidase
MGLETPVLVVIDMQNGFVNKYSHRVVDNVARLIEACRERLIPVVFTRFLNSSASPFETLIDWPHVSDEPDINIVDELSHNAKVVIDKNFYTAFTEAFDRVVQENGWKTLILCGVATESCVLKTAADAFERGLRPIVISDACASDAGDEAHRAGLFVLEFLIGKRQIMTIPELLEHLASSPVN